MELGRISNLPTCVSNVTAGYCLGGGNPIQTPVTFLAVLMATCLLYLSGMILNDLVDQKVDSFERPDRPLPSQRISRDEAWLWYTGLSSVSMILLSIHAPKSIPCALILCAMIALYNFTHQFSRTAPWLMGACRGMVYLLAAVAAGWSFGNAIPVKFFSLNLFFYIGLLTFIAKNELSEIPSFQQIMSLSIISTAFMLPLFIYGPQNIIFESALVGVAWIVFHLIKLKKNSFTPGLVVGRLIAGISLLDAVALAFVGSMSGVLLAWICFLGTLAGQRKIRGT